LLANALESRCACARSASWLLLVVVSTRIDDCLMLTSRHGFCTLTCQTRSPWSLLLFTAMYLGLAVALIVVLLRLVSGRLSSAGSAVVAETEVLFVLYGLSIGMALLVTFLRLLFRVFKSLPS
jgi:hypothetical protein